MSDSNKKLSNPEIYSGIGISRQLISIGRFIWNYPSVWHYETKIQMEVSMGLKKFVLSSTQQVILIALAAAGCATMAANAQTVNNNGEGTNSGFFYSLFTSGGSATMTFPLASKYPGNYAITWSGVNDVVGGKGWNPGSARTIGYNVGSASGYNNISIYGWTTNPLVEYYICEFGSVATGSAKGSVSSDGHTYTTYEHQQVNQPSIQGTATFNQFLDNWGGSSMGSNHTSPRPTTSITGTVLE